MTTLIENEAVVSKAKAINREVRNDNSCKLLTLNFELLENKTESTIKKFEISHDVMRFVEASKLSLDDKFMQYKPKEGTRSAKTKKRLINAIQSGNLKDFWRPNMDPSFDETGEGLCYVAGRKPAVGKSSNWWNEVAKKSGLQQGTNKQYVAFLGFLIKSLVEKGWDVEEAWHAVCIDSKNLGHYWNLSDAKKESEMTGSREICGFFDLEKSLENSIKNNEISMFSRDLRKVFDEAGRKTIVGILETAERK